MVDRLRPRTFCFLGSLSLCLREIYSFDSACIIRILLCSASVLLGENKTDTLLTYIYIGFRSITHMVNYNSIKKNDVSLQSLLVRLPHSFSDFFFSFSISLVTFHLALALHCNGTIVAAMKKEENESVNRVGFDGNEILAKFECEQCKNCLHNHVNDTIARPIAVNSKGKCLSDALIQEPVCGSVEWLRSWKSGKEPSLARGIARKGSE